MVFSGDVGTAKNEVPDEQQVAVVALVVTDAVVVGDGVVRPVGGGGRDGGLELLSSRKSCRATAAESADDFGRIV